MADDRSKNQGAGAKGDSKFNISAVLLEKYPKLVELIKKTESMSDDEREYWFQILPIMTEEQVLRLKGILEEESKQLADLDQKYQEELGKIGEKHESDWDEVGQKKAKEHREKRAKKEEGEEAEEAAAEAALLEQLDD